LLNHLTAFILGLLLCSNVQAEQHRSQKAKAIFKHSHPCPATGRTKGSCPDYIIDHIKPLACGGADHPSNMQWQTKADAKQKDKWERNGC
jgi:hypothetical protein